MIAIGRGDGLFASVKHLYNLGYAFDLIITDTAYAEYNIKESDYEELAKSIGAKFICRKDILLDDFIDCEPDFVLSANWKYKIKPEIINAFPYGIINCHMGQLPNYKGNATPNWLLLEGELQMYIDIHKMEDELDTGDIISRKIINIDESFYIEQLWDAYNQHMPNLFEDAINKLTADKQFSLIKNDLNGLRCYPRSEEDHKIDWRQDAKYISRLIRASSKPLKGSYCSYNEQKVTIWKAVKINLPFPYLALPGQVLTIDKLKNTVTVACNNGAIELQQISIDGEIILPTQLVRSIKKRFY